MKKILAYIFIFIFIVSCGGDVTSDGNKNNNGSNNPSQGNDNPDDPCTKPVAEDGETPPSIPAC